MANTAVSANGENARTITFSSKVHENFYLEYLTKCRYQDVYHKDSNDLTKRREKNRLAKVEELEEANYNQIDGILNNGKRESSEKLEQSGKEAEKQKNPEMDGCGCLQKNNAFQAWL